MTALDFPVTHLEESVPRSSLVPFLKCQEQGALQGVSNIKIDIQSIQTNAIEPMLKSLWSGYMLARGEFKTVGSDNSIAIQYVLTDTGLRTSKCTVACMLLL